MCGPRTEKSVDSVPVVSICCSTFNHEMYIERTLLGFVNQEFDEAFEVLVHDDCSTDNTREIIKRIEKEFPKLIKPIFQETNQYTLGIWPDFECNVPRARRVHCFLRRR